MIKELKKHPVDYLSLIALLVLLLGGFFVVKPNVMLQRSFSILLGVGYFVWGMLHHNRQKNLTKHIVLEYFFVSMLATTLLILVTMQ